MSRCFDESHRAYEAGDGARAKELSNEGHAHQREMNNLNAQASDWIFQGGHPAMRRMMKNDIDLSFATVANNSASRPHE